MQIRERAGLVSRGRGGRRRGSGVGDSLAVSRRCQRENRSDAPRGDEEEQRWPLGHTRARYLSPREPVAVFEMSVESAAGLTLRGGNAGAGAWLEDEDETGPMTPTLPPRTPSSAECCLLEDCELWDSQRRPPPLLVTTAPPPVPPA